MEVAINHWAVLLATAGYMAIGYAWYSPALFGSRWADLMGWPLSDKEAWAERQQGMGKTMSLALLSALVLALVSAHFLAMMGVRDMGGAIQFAVWAWFGFIATTSFTNALFGRKPKTLWAIDAGYPLAGLIVMSLILTLWP